MAARDRSRSPRRALDYAAPDPAPEDDIDELAGFLDEELERAVRYI